MAKFPSGFLTPRTRPDEMLVAIRLPPNARPQRSCFTEFARRHGDYAVVAAAAILSLDGQGRIGEATVALGGTAAAPLRVIEAERMLEGASADQAIFAAAAACCRSIEAMEDPQTPPWYRRRLAEVLVRRALETAWTRSGAA